MKKALVLSLVLTLSLGFAAFAQTWVGTWDTDIVLDPSAVQFADFVTFDSDLTVTYTIAGWDFGVDVDFSVGGMDGLDFDAGGSLGAFVFDVDIDFEPMYKTDTTVAYTTLAMQSAADQTTLGTCSSLQTDSWIYTGKTTTYTHVPAFDDLTATGEVSIAGVTINGLFFLESTDSDEAVAHTTWHFGTLPQQASSGGSVTSVSVNQSSSQVAVTPSTKVGSGWRLKLSGSFGGATVTSYTYFNLIEKMYNDGNSSSAHDYTYNSLKKYGSISGLACDGCSPAFYEQYALVEGLAFFNDCLTLDIGIRFTCCNFQWVGFLFKDIALGSFMEFDMLIKFETTAKTVTMEPEITLENACFSIDAALDYTAGATFTLNAIEIEGFSYSQTFNGLTVAFAQSWDMTDNPLIGTASTITDYYNGYLHFWKPDANRFAPSANTPAVDMATGEGYWVLVDLACAKEVATVYNKLSIDYDADGCCGGAFDLDVDTYFGSVLAYNLTGVYGTYYYDILGDGTYAGLGTDIFEFLGPANGYADYVALTDVTDEEPDATAAAADPNDECDPCDTATYEDSDSMLVGYYGAGTAVYTILGWVETDADIVFGVGSNISIGVGIDVAWYGWDELSLSVLFEW